MSEYIFKMPDLGEGTVSAEIVAWHTQPGDQVSEDQLIVEVMTDKAAVEVPAPVSGTVVSIHGALGDKVAVGAPLIVFDVVGRPVQSSPAKVVGTPAEERLAAPLPPPASSPSATPPSNGSTRAMRIMASPANRRRAREAGIDLGSLTGSGPGGRIVRDDLERVASAARAPVPLRDHDTPPTTEIKIIGLRRLIAERMSEAKRTIPHFSYIEEVDVTELEALRLHLNQIRPTETGALNLLPFVLCALTRVLELFPQCNVLHDAARGVLVRHRAVHAGIATQTSDGLKVPVVRNAQELSIWQLSAQIRRLAERARNNEATREELTGSTITVTSLGKLGGIASTPIINSPEVAIIGLNKAAERPVIHGGVVAVRRIMNLSSSFDHRFVDGYDAAAMIQALKARLEHPATIFIPKVSP